MKTQNTPLKEPRTIRIGEMLYTKQQDGSWSGHNGGNQHTGWGCTKTNDEMIDELKKYRRKLSGAIEQVDREIMILT